MFKAICSTGRPELLDAETIAALVLPVSFAVAETRAPARHALAVDADAWQMRVDMTLADAEDLVEELRALIAAAKDGLRGQAGAQPTALALAGLKIGAQPNVAPPRLSATQLEALSRLQVRRGLNIGADGRVVHSFSTPPQLQQKPAFTGRD